MVHPGGALPLERGIREISGPPLGRSGDRTRLVAAQSLKDRRHPTRGLYARGKGDLARGPVRGRGNELRMRPLE